MQTGIKAKFTWDLMEKNPLTSSQDLNRRWKYPFYGVIPPVRKHYLLTQAFSLQKMQYTELRRKGKENIMEFTGSSCEIFLFYYSVTLISDWQNSEQKALGSPSSHTGNSIPTLEYQITLDTLQGSRTESKLLLAAIISWILQSFTILLASCGSQII